MKVQPLARLYPVCFMKLSEMEPKKKRLLAVFCGVVAALLLAAAVGLVVFYKMAQHTVTFITAEGSTTMTVLSTDWVEMPAVEAPEKLNFTGWTDARGSRETRSSLHIYEDTVYTAHYITALETETHPAYLFEDEDGLFRADENLTRSEAAQAIYALLCGKVEEDGNFADVDASMACAKGTAQLKALGIVEGTHFNPEDDITWAELIDLFASFYCRVNDGTEFEVIRAKDYGYEAYCTAVSLGWFTAEDAPEPENSMTRREAAEFINRVLGRSSDPNLTLKETGPMPDCAPFDDAYIAFAEAAVSHTCEKNEDGSETWLESEPITQRYEGYVIVGNKLRDAGEDGLFAIGYNEDGFFFVDSGSFTSGNTELDDVVWAILSEITDSSMTQEEKLRAAYDYVVANFKYIGKHIYEEGETGWEVKEALEMFETHKGNCYSFAAAFWALARGLGYDAQAVSGICAPGTEHGWVQIFEGHQWYIYDTEIENTNPGLDRFKLDRTRYYTWGYNPDPQYLYELEQSEAEGITIAEWREKYLSDVYTGETPLERDGG